MKLQPNFSWQKYEGEPESQKEQFQYQLQQQHVQVANTTNADIDDSSFWTRERGTAWTWTNGKQIYTKTITLTLTALGANAQNHGITGIVQVVWAYGIAQDAVPLSVSAVPIPTGDPSAANDGILLTVTPTQVVVTINGAASAWQNYVAFVTLGYTKS